MATAQQRPSPPTARAATGAQWIVTLLAVAFTVGAYGSGYSRALLRYDRVGDFFQEWASARNFFTGQPIYTPQQETAERYLNYRAGSQRVFVNVNAHPPTSVLMTLPFGWLEYRRAFLLWNLLSLAAVVALGWLVSRDAWRGGRFQALWPVMALMGSPLFQHVSMGQLTIWVLVLLVGADRAARAGRHRQAGVWLGTAIALKWFPAFLLLYFLARRRWSTLWVAGGCFLLWNLAALLLFGSSTYRDFFGQSLPEVLSYCDWWGNQSLLAFWFKLFAGWSGQTAPLFYCPPLAWTGAVVSVGAVAGLVAWLAWRERDDPGGASFAAAVVAMTLLSPICWNHYLLLLMTPLVLLDGRVSARGPVRWCLNAALFAIWFNPEALWFVWVQGQASAAQVLLLLSWHFHALCAVFALTAVVAWRGQHETSTARAWSMRVADRCDRLLRRKLSWVNALVFGVRSRASLAGGEATLADSEARARWRPWQYLAPNAGALAVTILGVGVECWLLSRRADNVFQFGLAWTCQVALCIAWLWLGGVWFLWLASRGLVHVARGWPRLARWMSYTVGAVGGVTLLAVYLASWGMYLQTGSFASREAIEFIVANARESLLANYLLRSEVQSLVIAVAALVAIVVAGVALWPRFVAAHWTPGAGLSRRLALRRWCAWLALLVVPLTIGTFRPARTSHSQLVLRHESLINQLNPTLTLMFSGLRGVVAEPIEPVLDERELRPIREVATLAARPDRPSIIFVAVESLRHDVVGLVHQGREVTPHLNALARGGVQWTRAYSQSTHSDYADVCIVSSLYPLRTRRHHYYRADDPWPKTCIYDCLKPAGYATAIISSQNENWGKMYQFLNTPQLDLFYDAERSQQPTAFDGRDGGFAYEIVHGELRAGKLDDAHTADVAARWIGEQTGAGRPYFLSVNFQSSHFPYDVPASAVRPFAPAAIDFPASFAYYPPDKVDVVRNAYYNALHYTDAQLGRLVQSLRDQGQLDNTILVVMGENGEAFHENNSVTHAGLPMEPTLRVACVLHAPRLAKPRVDDYPVELIDLAPSVLGLAGWPAHPNFQGLDVFRPDRPATSARTLYFHVENPLAHADALLLAGRWKFIRNRATQQEMLFDVAVDPGEQSNLAGRPEYRELTQLLHDAWTRWRERQLAYYHYPAYYRRYYPPSPPVVDAYSVLSRLPQQRVAGEQTRGP
ncbi:MAG: sulfatase-like hydrolase/transferase [Planctomycetes bacterium]|nr:sulfatase-like hydrolase/transferase [Planctomycetota bacterium]